jgi:hypothetical protein
VVNTKDGDEAARQRHIIDAALESIDDPLDFGFDAAECFTVAGLLARRRSQFPHDPRSEPFRQDFAS